MVALLVIACFLIQYAAEGVPPAIRDLPTATIAGFTVAGHAVLLAAAWATAWRAGRRIDRAGDPRAVRLVERTLAFVRMAAVVWHGLATLGLGWGDWARTDAAGGGSSTGIADLAAVAPPIAALAALWLIQHPIERRLHAAAVMRALDDGLPVAPLPGRLAWAWQQVRHQMLLTLLPISLMVVWSELSALGVSALAGGDPSGGLVLRTIGGTVRIAGIAAVLAVTPWLLMRIWDTTPIRPGPLLDDLRTLCARHRVSVRRHLVWLTGGSMVNGAVVGLMPRMRYLVLTDGLLERLTMPQIRAVLAHEVAHLRHRHMLWLGGVVLATVTIVGAVAVAADAGVRTIWPDGSAAAVFEASVLVVTLAVTFTVIGWVSRRFEWQADAFAAAELSRADRWWRSDEDQTEADREASENDDAAPREPGEFPEVVRPEAAAAMAGALSRVAALNGVSPSRWTWRHGSIARRRRNVLGLIGRPLTDLRPDRVSRRIRIATLAGVALSLVILGLEVAIAITGGSAEMNADDAEEQAVMTEDGRAD